MSYSGTFEPPFWGGDLTPAPIAGPGTLTIVEQGVRVRAFWAETCDAESAPRRFGRLRRTFAVFALALQRPRQRPSARPVDLFYAWPQLLGIAHDPRDPTVVVLAIRHVTDVLTLHFRPEQPVDLVLEQLHAWSASEVNVLAGARYVS